MTSIVVVGRTSSQARVAQYLELQPKLDVVQVDYGQARQFIERGDDLIIFPLANRQRKYEAAQLLKAHTQARKRMVLVHPESDAKAEFEFQELGVVEQRIVPVPSRLEGDLPVPTMKLLRNALQPLQAPVASTAEPAPKPAKKKKRWIALAESAALVLAGIGLNVLKARGIGS